VGNKKYIFAIDSHTMGEPTRAVIGGMKPIPGKTMVEKQGYLAANFDYIRTALMHESRGHSNMFGSIIMEPTNPRADFGIVFMDGSGYLNMCVHGTIGAVTVAIEMGLVEIMEPKKKITLETPAGLIFASAELEGGAVKSVKIENVPSFLYCKDTYIGLPEVGTIPADIAFGGNFSCFSQC
jgi:proline racemase